MDKEDKTEQRLQGIEKKVDENGKAIKANSERLGRVEKKVDENTQRLDRVEQKVDDNTTRLDRVEKKVDDNTQRLDRVEKKVDLNTTEVKGLRGDVEVLKGDVTFIIKQMDENQREIRRLFGVKDEQAKSDLKGVGEGVRANRERLDDHESRIQDLEAS